MLVLYYFQAEIGESLEQPNALVVKGDRVSFQDFLALFPFKNYENYKFRFRKDDNTYGYVWVDISNKNEILPIYNGVITAKILKLDSVHTNARKIFLKQKQRVLDKSLPIYAPGTPSTERGAAPPPLPPRQRQPKETPSSVNIDIDDIQRSKTQPQAQPSPVTTGETSGHGSGKYSKSAKPAPQQQQQQQKTNILDDDEHEHEQPSSSEEPNLWADASSSPKPSQHQDILNFDEDDGYSHNPSKQYSNGDMLDFMGGGGGNYNASKRSPKPSNTSTIDIDEGPSASGKLSRAELVANREAKISEKVQTALEFKVEMDSKKLQEEQEFDMARGKHDKELNVWATGINGKEKRNIRNLLSSMHTVLPKDTKWKAIGLGDVLEPKQVKLQYRKAMLVVHPDHCIGADFETKFICKRIFEALNEAWDDFSKKEGV